MKKLICIYFLIVIIFSGCADKKTNEKIRIATLKGPSAMGMVRMIDSLSHLDNPTIEITIYNEPIQVRKLMLENEVDLAILPTTMGAILYNKHLPYQLAAIPVWGTLYLFGQDTTIKSWDDLRGRRIHVMAKGMTPDVLFKHLLIKNDINSEQDVVLDYSFPTHIDLANAVAAGQTDLAVISEPLVSLVMQKNRTVQPIFDLNAEWKKVHKNTPIAQTALLVHSDFARQQTKMLRNILNSYKTSSNWVNKTKLPAAELLVQHKILPNIEVAQQAIPRSNLDFKEITQIQQEVEDYLSIFFNLNPDIIGGKIPIDNFYLNLR